MNLVASALLYFAAAAGQFSLEQLQGAWWAEEPSPTVAFAIEGDRIWFDYDMQYHPLRIEGDLMIVDLGPGEGLVKSRIVSVGEGRLVLQDLDPPSALRTYTLAEP